MVMELPVDLTPELVPLYWLIGEWEGTGRLGAGEAGDASFHQKLTFTDTGLPFLEYRSESWLLNEEDGQLLRPLATEVGFWALDRPQEDGDVGPGMTPADIVPVYRSAEDVEKLRTQDGGFDITATVAHPGGLTELYYGAVKGPQVQIVTDAVMRGEHTKEYLGGTRMYGLVNNDLYWRWDLRTAEGSEPHASGILKKKVS
ncbi:FABP family protein [Micrococcoides hystricis]|uniref:Peroxynitrite isomerase n=1 Tax=Micrococcoides hystricis TaxID=1572761 RepID=A0ABV6P9U2_9MICC